MLNYQQFVDNWLKQRIPQPETPGLAVCVLVDGRVVFAKTYGHAHVGSKEVLTPTHLFPIGSQSKMITATAVMRLIEANRLQLDDRVADILPWLGNHPDPAFGHITVHQLLWHGAGLIRDGQDANYWQLARNFPTAAELKQIILESQLTHPPGKRFKYSNIGYGLLGQVIEAVSGKAYGDFCTSEVIDKLTTRQLTLAPGARNLATGTTPSFNGHRLATPKNLPTNALAPATGWWATAEAMCRFLATHLDGSNHTLLSDSSKRFMRLGVRNHWQPHANRSIDYGLGMQTYEFDGVQWIGHSGTTVGHRTLTVHDPITNTTVAVMSNAKDAPVHNIFRGIAGVIGYFRHVKPAVKSLRPFATTLTGMAGHLQFVPIGNRLVVINPDSWQPLATVEELEQVGPDTFKIVAAHDLAARGELVRFKLGKNGVESAVYGGSTLLPEAQYLRWLRRNFANWAPDENAKL